MEQLTRHPLSTLWGDMPEDQYREFVEGIRERHIRQMIMTLDGEILDGWHRYKACLELCIEPFFAIYTEDDPVGYVIRQNAMRRHLTQMQYRVGILMSHGIRGAGEYDRGKRIDSIPLPPTIQQHIESFGGSRPGWLNALAIVKAGYAPQVMSGEPAQPFLDQIHQSKAGMDDDIPADSQPDESLAPGSGDETDSPDEGTDDVHTGDDGGHRPATGESETTQPDVGPEGTGPGVVTTPNTDDGPPAEKPPKAKGPTLTERLEAQVDALQMEVQEKAQHIDDLEDQVRFHQGNMSENSHERHKAFTALQAENRTLRSQVNEWMTKHNEELRSRRYWEKWAKDNGWTVEEVKL